MLLAIGSFLLGSVISGIIAWLMGGGPSTLWVTLAGIGAVLFIILGSMRLAPRKQTSVTGMQDPYDISDPYHPDSARVAREARRNRRGTLIASAVALVLGLATFFVVPGDDTESNEPEESPSPSAPAPAPAEESTKPEIPEEAETPNETPSPTPSPEQLNPYAADDLATIFAELEAMAGHNEVAEVVVRDDRVDATMSLTPGDTRFDDYSYTRGEFAHDGPTLIQPRLEDNNVFTLADIDPQVVAEVVAGAVADADGIDQEIAELTHVIISFPTWTSTGDQPTMRVYVSDPYNSAMLTYSFSGELLRLD